jgi:hypothetical protein
VLTIVIFVLVGLFALLTLGRIGGAQRTLILARWPVFALAGAAIFALARGAMWPALALGSLSALVWLLWPRLAVWDRRAEARQRPPEDAADIEARQVLGVGANATESDIRSAYRTKMRQAHPDRGGAHNEAARLTAARDRLLKKRR